MKEPFSRYAYSLRMELQLLGVFVTVLRPGAVKTDMLGVSTTALDRFCENTKLYACNAKRFKRIVEGVEAKNIPPEKEFFRSSSDDFVLYRNEQGICTAIFSGLPKYFL